MFWVVHIECRAFVVTAIVCHLLLNLEAFFPRLCYDMMWYIESKVALIITCAFPVCATKRENVTIRIWLCYFLRLNILYFAPTKRSF